MRHLGLLTIGRCRKLLLLHGQIMDTDTNRHICAICGESKGPSKARFEHRRLSLDNPPKPVVCKCKTPNKVLSSIWWTRRRP